MVTVPGPKLKAHGSLAHAGFGGRDQALLRALLWNISPFVRLSRPSCNGKMTVSIQSLSSQCSNINLIKGSNLFLEQCR